MNVENMVDESTISSEILMFRKKKLKNQFKCHYYHIFFILLTRITDHELGENMTFHFMNDLTVPLI